MNIFIEFLKNFAFEIIFFFLFAGGIFTFLIANLTLRINAKKMGIHKIHKKGMNVKNLEKDIKNAREVNIISFMPYNFLVSHRELLEEKIADGCFIKILMCDRNSKLLQELSVIERGTEEDILLDFDRVLNLLRAMKNNVGANATGRIEVRQFNTEIRNPAFVCRLSNEKISAFQTVSTPPKTSIESIMIEYHAKNCDGIVTYFNTIWNRHDGNDIVLKI